MALKIEEVNVENLKQISLHKRRGELTQSEGRRARETEGRDRIICANHHSGLCFGRQMRPLRPEKLSPSKNRKQNKIPFFSSCEESLINALPTYTYELYLSDFIHKMLTSVCLNFLQVLAL